MKFDAQKGKEPDCFFFRYHDLLSTLLGPRGVIKLTYKVLIRTKHGTAFATKTPAHLWMKHRRKFMFTERMCKCLKFVH